MTTKKRLERKRNGAEQPEQAKHSLQFNVAQLLKNPGSDSQKYIIEQAVISSLDQEFTLSDPLDGYIKLIKTDREILVIGQLETEVLVPCTRCLIDVKTPLTLELEEIFSPTVDITTGSALPFNEDADEATMIDEKHILDLAEVVRQTIHLSLPGQILCQPNCRGLCVQCGTTLNKETCNCTTETIDSRWASLLALKDDEPSSLET